MSLRGRFYSALGVFLKRDDINEESKRKLLVDNTVRLRSKRADVLRNTRVRFASDETPP
jgi:hypothetical protein